MKKFFIITLLIPLLNLTSLPLAIAESTQLILTVHGLACPFCAFGLEKKIKKLEGFESYDADLKKGEVYVTLNTQAKTNIEPIKKAVKEAGFTLVTITQKTNDKIIILYSSEKEK